MELKTKDMWGIYFTSPSFERLRYMNIGFETKEKAQKQLDIILKERKKSQLPHQRIKSLQDAGLHVSSVLTGTNWRIKKIKLRNEKV